MVGGSTTECVRLLKLLWVSHKTWHVSTDQMGHGFSTHVRENVFYRGKKESQFCERPYGNFDALNAEHSEGEKSCKYQGMETLMLRFGFFLFVLVVVLRFGNRGGAEEASMDVIFVTRQFHALKSP